MTTPCCGARTRLGPDDGGADEGLCNVCSDHVCTECAVYFSREDGYGDDGQGVRTDALCASCHSEREERRQQREWRKDSSLAWISAKTQLKPANTRSKP